MALSKQDAAQPAAASKEEAQSGMAADARGPAPENMPKQPAEGSLKEADKVAGPFIDDAEANDPPVRTNRPDVPIIQTLKTGAGAHKPPTDPKVGPDGRYYAAGEYRDGEFYQDGYPA